MTIDSIPHILLTIVPIMLAIILHEVSHGFVALALGDTTARDQGRLTLNPIAHVDRMGTIVIPGILLIMQWGSAHPFLFGWAKPVSVSAWKFANPRRGMALVAIAGPAMNFLLFWLAAMAIRALLEADVSVWMASVLFYFMMVNIVLGLFNLLPIPPLDGGRIVVGLLPEHLARSWAGLERYGLLIVLAFVLVLPQVFGINPIGDILEVVVPKAFWLVGLPS